MHAFVYQLHFDKSQHTHRCCIHAHNLCGWTLVYTIVQISLESKSTSQWVFCLLTLRWTMVMKVKTDAVLESLELDNGQSPCHPARQLCLNHADDHWSLAACCFCQERAVQILLLQRPWYRERWGQGSPISEWCHHESCLRSGSHQTAVWIHVQSAPEKRGQKRRSDAVVVEEKENALGFKKKTLTANVLRQSVFAGVLRSSAACRSHTLMVLHTQNTTESTTYDHHSDSQTDPSYAPLTILLSSNLIHLFKSEELMVQWWE